MNWATRTLVPIIVGTLLGWAAKAGFNIDSGALETIVTGVVIGLYVVLARWVEKTWPGLGKILMTLGLSSKQPEYHEPQNINPYKAA